MQSIFYALDVYFRELNSYLALSRFSIEFFWNKIQSKRETSNINNENKNKKNHPETTKSKNYVEFNKRLLYNHFSKYISKSCKQHEKKIYNKFTMGKNQFFFIIKFQPLNSLAFLTTPRYIFMFTIQAKLNSLNNVHEQTTYLQAVEADFLNVYFHTKGGMCPLRKKIGDIDMGDIADIAIVLALLTIKYT